MARLLKIFRNVVKKLATVLVCIEVYFSLHGFVFSPVKTKRKKKGRKKKVKNSKTC